MRVYTAQMRYRGPDRVDITRSTGDTAFAPSWELLNALKSGRIAWDEYRRRYRIEMRRSYAALPRAWAELIDRAEVTLCCYCAPGKNCHRLLLVEILRDICERLGIPFEYGGERSTPTAHQEALF
jgi:uncharacterized protein YeaO (DUF488 family)